MELIMESGPPMEKKRKMNVIFPVELELCISQTAAEEEPLQNELSEMKTLFGQMLDDQFTDVKLVSADEEIFAHKSILFGRIPYFKEVLSYDATNNILQLNDCLEVPPEILPVTMKLIVRYAYFCEPMITLQNAQALLEAAAFFRIEDLWAFCDQFLAKRIVITMENCLTIQSYAVGCYAKLLKLKADQFIAEHLNELCDTEAFKYMSEEEMAMFLSTKDLEVLPNEEKFWEALIKWIQADPKIRKSAMPRLLGFLRLPCLSAGVINQMVLPHPYIASNPECQTMINDLLLYKADPNNTEILRRCEAAFSMKQRCKKIAHIFYFDVWKSYDGLHNRIHVLKNPNGKWVEKSWKGFPIMLKKVVAVKYIVYLVSNCKVLLVYNSITETSTVIQGDNFRPDLLKMELCCVSGQLVACGPSRDRNQMLVWCYDSPSNSWQRNTLRWPPEVDVGVKACCGVTYGDNGDNEILCVVSYDANSFRVILFDIETGDLIKCGRLLGIDDFDDEQAKVVRYTHGKVFVAIDDCWIAQYDVTQDDWSLLPDVEYEPCGAVAVASDRLCVITTTVEKSGISSGVKLCKDFADHCCDIQDGPAVFKNDDLGHYDDYSYYAVVCQYP